MTQIQHEEDRTEALRRLLVATVEETATAAPLRAGRSPRLIAITAGLAVAAVATVVAVPLVNSLQPPATSEPPGQTSGTSSGSRMKLYTSLAELAADSGAVVTGTVLSQRPGADSTVVSTLEVTGSYRPSGLGSNLPGPVSVAKGTVVQVTTFGPMTSAGSAQLEAGQEYLLFLTPTGVPGAGADEFFITGVGAGLYLADGDRYVKAPSEGDLLPAELTPGSLVGQ